PAVAQDGDARDALPGSGFGCGLPALAGRLRDEVEEHRVLEHAHSPGARLGAQAIAPGRTDRATGRIAAGVEVAPMGMGSLHPAGPGAGRVRVELDARLGEGDDRLTAGRTEDAHRGLIAVAGPGGEGVGDMGGDRVLCPDDPGDPAL